MLLFHRNLSRVLFDFLLFFTNRATFVVIAADNSEEVEVEEEETNPTIQQHPLRRADSEDQLRQQFEDGEKESSCA